MAYKGGQYTVTGTATNITTALSLGDKVHCKEIIVQGKTGNAQKAYLGGSTVAATPANARAEVGAGLAVAIGPFDGQSVNTDEVFIIGTANDVVFITLVS